MAEFEEERAAQAAAEAEAAEAAGQAEEAEAEDPEASCEVGEECESGYCGTIFIDDVYFSKYCVGKYDCDGRFTTADRQVLRISCNDNHDPDAIDEEEIEAEVIAACDGAETIAE